MPRNIRISLKDATAERIAKGATAFVIPIEPQPSYTWDINAWGWSIKFIPEIEPFCQPGEPLYLMETWARVRISGGFDYYYKADDSKLFRTVLRWHSPATMPNIACRHIWTAGKIEAVRVKRLTVKQARNIILEKSCDIGHYFRGHYFRDWFAETYPHLNMDSWVWYIEKGEDNGTDTL